MAICTQCGQLFSKEWERDHHVQLAHSAKFTAWIDGWYNFHGHMINGFVPCGVPGCSQELKTSSIWNKHVHKQHTQQILNTMANAPQPSTPVTLPGVAPTKRVGSWSGAVHAGGAGDCGLWYL